jgi:hypothetical protein
MLAAALSVLLVTAPPGPELVPVQPKKMCKLPPKKLLDGRMKLEECFDAKDKGTCCGYTQEFESGLKCAMVLCQSKCKRKWRFVYGLCSDAIEPKPKETEVQMPISCDAQL